MAATRKLSKTITLYLLGTLVSIVGVFAVIEVVTRTLSLVRGDGFSLALHELDATDGGILELYRFHPFVGFTFKPDSVFLGSHPAQREPAQIFTDEHGFLSKPQSLPLQKSPGEVRIATIGASTTANINLNYAQNWPGRLGALVTEALPDKEVTVINAGIPGFDTAQSVGNLALRVMPFKPDVVIIYHAYNDLKVVSPDFDVQPDYANVHDKPFGAHARPNWILRVLNNSMFYVRTRNSYRQYKNVVAKVDMLKGENRLARVPDTAAAIFEHNVRTMVAIARAGGARVVLSSFATLHDLDVDYSEASATQLSEMQRSELFSIMHFTPGLNLGGIFEGLSRYNEILKNLAQELDTGWVDNAKLIEHSDENFVDRVHFNVAGAEKMARNFHPVVQERLRLRAPN